MNTLIYIRTSTDKQNNSLAVQERLCKQFCDRHGYSVVSVLSETASGKDDERPVFNQAVARCKSEGLILVAAKIDRLARRISTIGKLIDSGVQLRVVAIGNQPVSKMVLAVFSAMAEVERDFISARTKEALAHLKAKGVKLGNPNLEEARLAGLQARKSNAAAFRAQMRPVIQELQADGLSTLQELADSLNRRGYTARRGGKFHPSSVRAILTA